MKITSKQITAEIVTLRELLSRLKVKATAFGDRHDHAIEAQIATLSNQWTEDDCEDRYGSGEDGYNVFDAARDAAMWLAGDSEDAPSKGWIESTHLFNPK